MKTIGIIGGAGPMAGALLTKKIIENCQSEYGCINDYDYPQMILFSYPFAEMLQPNTAFQQESVVTKQLDEALDFLVNNGADYLAIACNTLHSFLDKGDYTDKLICLIEETRNYLKEQGFSRVFVLCTKTSAECGIYNFSCSQLPYMGEQELVDRIIRNVLQGSFTSLESRLLEALIASKVKLGGVVLLGCTELSVLHNQYPIEVKGVKIIDPLDITSNKLCRLIF